MLVVVDHCGIFIKTLWLRMRKREGQRVFFFHWEVFCSHVSSFLSPVCLSTWLLGCVSSLVAFLHLFNDSSSLKQWLKNC
jgi:hypothetical protein